MMRGTSSIKAVALDLGFKDASRFSHDFKRHYGRSPSEFVKDKTCNTSFFEI